jgi:D-3-phosphoglycerate dehydrogenase
MWKIQTLNAISAQGLDRFPRSEYETASEFSNPDAIVVRSADLHQLEFPAALKTIARAGIGVNNIPIERCTDRGIVVFNTPGANANSVKELTLAGLFLASRRIFEGMTWVRTLVGKGDEIPTLYEKSKRQFEGPEITGKTLGVIGLGSVGVMVANAAVALGMHVVGFDPFISVESAWGLSSSVRRSRGLDTLVGECDYISIHVPLNEKTRGMLSKERFALMKRGVRLLNFARGGLVNNEDLGQAIRDGLVSRYVTDFPDEELLHMDNVLCIPHLGASTPEAEANCAVMAVEQLKGFLERGEIDNSVNFPACRMDMVGNQRLVVANRNIPNMVGQITTVLAREDVNISDMLNRHRDGIAYNIIDIDRPLSEKARQMISAIEGVIMVRSIETADEPAAGTRA